MIFAIETKADVLLQRWSAHEPNDSVGRLARAIEKSVKITVHIMPNDALYTFSDGSKALLNKDSLQLV